VVLVFVIVICGLDMSESFGGLVLWFLDDSRLPCFVVDLDV
jgi:hypothetical protein